MARVEQTASQRAVSLPGVNEGKEKFSFARACYAIATKEWDEAPFERDVFKETRKRALSTGTDTAGGYIVPEQYMAELIPLLRAKLVVQAAGATILDGLTGTPVEIPSQTGGATAAWLAENGTITATDQTLGLKQLTPKMVAAMTKMSRRVQNLSNPSIEAMVRDDLAKVLALAADIAYLKGDGVGKPTGIYQQVTPADQSAAEIDYPDLVDIMTSIRASNVDGPLSFIWHPTFTGKVGKVRIAQFSGQTAAQFPGWVFPPFASAQQLATIMGAKAVGETTQLAATEFVCGVFSELIVGIWGSLVLDATTTGGTAFEQHQLWVKAVMEVDSVVRHAESFRWNYNYA